METTTRGRSASRSLLSGLGLIARVFLVCGHSAPDLRLKTWRNCALDADNVKSRTDFRRSDSIVGVLNNTRNPRFSQESHLGSSPQSTKMMTALYEHFDDYIFCVPYTANFWNLDLPYLYFNRRLKYITPVTNTFLIPLYSRSSH